jgi:hypothetical protein
MIGWGLLALGGILLLSLVWRATLGLWRRLQPLNVWVRYAEEASPFRRRRQIWGGVGIVVVLLLSLCLGVAGGAALYVENRGVAYVPFPVDEVVARVQCLPVEQVSGTMSCTLTLKEQAPYVVTLEGVRWGMEGEVLTWDPAWERLGLRSGYRLLRLVSYDAAGRIVATHNLSTAGAGLGFLFSWLDSRFPMVAAREEVAVGDVVVGTFYELTVTRAGFALRKWESVQP